MTQTSPPERQATFAQRRRYPLWRLARANLYDFGLLLRESWIALAGFVGLALIGTAYLLLRYPATPASPRPGSVAEALYETLKLLSLQSGLAFPNGDLLGEVLFFLVPLLGLALIFQSVLNFGRLLLDKGSRREQWQIALASTFRGHVVVCGLGRVSVRVISQLIEAGYGVVAVERDPSGEFVERAMNFKVPVVLGDAREWVTLRRAGVTRAHAVIVAINDDLLNIEIALTARALRADVRVILRIFNDELDRNLERTFGPNAAFSASALAAPTFAAAAVSRAIDVVLPIGGHLIGVTRLSIQPDSRIAGFTRTIEEQHQIRVLSHQDQAGRPLRRGMVRPLSGGDQVTLLGTLEALETLREKNRAGSKLGFLSGVADEAPQATRPVVIICGLGRVGYRVVRQLWRLSPRPRIVVVHLGDSQPQFVRRIAQLDGVTLIVGDARELDVLRQAGVEHATSVAALTSDDSLNLQISLAARRHRPEIHIVLRVFSDTLAEKLAEMFGIRTAYSTSALAGATLAAAAAIGNVRSAFLADGQLYAVDRVVLGSGHVLAGRSVATIYEQHQALVIGLRRDDQTTPLPPFETVVNERDTLTLLATIDHLARLRRTSERTASA